MSFDKYPHIDNLYKRPDIFQLDEVLCTEKLHGCNFRVHLEDKGNGITDVTYGSRNHVVKRGDNFYADRPINWFEDQPHLMNDLCRAAAKWGPEVTVYGEIVGARIQKGVTYLDQEAITFRAFDVKVEGRFLDFNEFLEFIYRSGLVHVPTLYVGPPLLSKFNDLIEVNSLEAVRNGVDVCLKNITEGIVIRPTKMRKDHHDQWILAKHKSQGFAEASHAPRPVKERYENPCLLFAETYVTRGRVLNAIEKATSTWGETVKGDMSDMKFLPGIVNADVISDEPEATNGLSVKGLQSAITRQTAIVYKAILNERIGQ